MEPVPNAGKHATCAKHGKTCNLCQARENMQPVPSAGKHATCAKRGKTCNLCQVRENMQPVPNAGKHATCAKREKRCNCCQARKTHLSQVVWRVARKPSIFLNRETQNVVFILLNRMKSTIILKQRKSKRWRKL